MTKFIVAVEEHLQRFPAERPAIERFVDLFDIRWASHERIDRSESSFYLLKSKPHATELYGFERELLLVYTGYDALEPRTLQQCEEVVDRRRLGARIEPLYLVVVAPIEDMAGEVARYRQDAEQGRILVGFSVNELLTDKNPWLLRTRFSSSLFSRDLFDMKQALVADNYFFGRQALVLDLLDRLKRGENTGLYGLRKTGKTSALFKLSRLIQTELAGSVVYIDAQSPEIYQLRWWELVSHVKDEAARVAGVTLNHPLDRDFTEKTALTRARQAFAEILNRVRRTSPRLIVVIDEVEHLHPDLSPGKHWRDDFHHFWKLLRAIQTQERRLTFVIAGVNARVSESSTISDQDNPLFSLVGTRYLPPFLPNDTREMVQTLGKRMGIIFDVDSCNYLASRYGGHPMLVRLACSWEHHRRSSSSYTERPVQITSSQLIETEDERENDLVYYVRHVLDVLRMWYADEYELLTLLAKDRIGEFREYARELPESIQHLRAYGLIDRDTDSLSIGMVKKYLKEEPKRPQNKIDSSASADASSGDIARNRVGSPVAIEELVAQGEGPTVEFKSTLRVNLFTNASDQKIEQSALKTIAAFLNSAGGHLLIGVDDKGTPLGLSADNFPSEDKLTLHLVNLIKDRLGAQHAPLISARFVDFKESRVLVVDCARSPRPVFMKADRADVFYVRLLAATAELTARETENYIRDNFSPA